MSVNLNPPRPEPKLPALLYGEAYHLCAAINGLQGALSIACETGAIDRLMGKVRDYATMLGIDVGVLWQKYSEYARHIEETQVLARIEAGQIDHAIVKFPEHSRDILIVNDDGIELAIERTTGNKWRFCATTFDGQRPKLTTPKNMVSIPLDDAEVFLEEIKDHNAQQLGGGAVNMGPDLDRAERLENAIKNYKATLPPKALAALADAPTKVASVVIHKGGIEQIIFNIAHGLPDGVYELTQGKIKP